jgi:hypothetical protein
MKHNHGEFVHDHLNAEAKHRHPGGDHFWIPPHVAVSGPRESGEYFFVPGQVLISEEDFRREEVARILKAHGLRRFGGPTKDRWEVKNKVPPEELAPPPKIPGLVMLTMGIDAPQRLEIPDIVDELRKVAPDKPVPRVTPNHVYFGSTHKIFGPDTDPTPQPAAFESLPDNGVGRGVFVTVLDTGIVDHPLLPGFDPGEFDVPDEDGNLQLDHEAGHGAFIAGVIRRFAPSAVVTSKRVMTSNGRVSDTSLGMRLLECPAANIINLSLGTYTHDNTGPFAVPVVLDWLRHRNPDMAIVAAAGNDHSDRPVYPAALKGVIGVAACDEKGTKASYSNYGWWVDARARGDHVSTFYDFPLKNAAVQQASGVADPDDFNGWAYWDGTSFAAPVVSGAIAAEMTNAGGIGAREAAARLIQAASATLQPGVGVLISPTDFA